VSTLPFLFLLYHASSSLLLAFFSVIVSLTASEDGRKRGRALDTGRLGWR